MANLSQLMNPVTVARKLREHGIYNIARTATKPWKPLYEVERRAETALLRARHGDKIRQRRDLARQTLGEQPQYRGFIPKADRFRAVGPNDIPGMAALRDYCCRVYEAKMKEAQGLGQTYTSLLAPSIGNFQSGVVSDVSQHAPIQDFATSPAMTAIVADYLGEIPVVCDLSLSVTHPNVSKVGSQRFHLDHSPVPHVKFYLNICDVDDTCGPLTWLSARDTARVKSAKGYRFGRIEDEDVMAVVPEKHWVRHTGAGGSAAFLDTSRCLHFGSRGNAKDRVSIIIYYDALYANGGVDYKISIKFADGAARSPAQMLLLDKTA